MSVVVDNEVCEVINVVVMVVVILPQLSAEIANSNITIKMVPIRLPISSHHLVYCINGS